MPDHWMQAAFSAHPGRLHRALHVADGQKIPASRLASAARSSDPHMRQMANLAKRGKAAKHVVPGATRHR